MKYLPGILFSLLLAPVVWAGEASPIQMDTTYGMGKPTISTESSAQVYLPAGVKPNGDIGVIQIDRDGYVKLNPCLSQMENAMRAMEPFMKRVPMVSQRQLTDLEIGNWNDAIDQWWTTKRLCWRQP